MIGAPVPLWECRETIRGGADAPRRAPEEDSMR
jgi:hypothetical protein